MINVLCYTHFVSATSFLKINPMKAYNALIDEDFMDPSHGSKMKHESTFTQALMYGRK
jgi:hypothetical protein